MSDEEIIQTLMNIYGKDDNESVLIKYDDIIYKVHGFGFESISSDAFLELTEVDPDDLYDYFMNTYVC